MIRGRATGMQKSISCRVAVMRQHNQLPALSITNQYGSSTSITPRASLVLHQWRQLLKSAPNQHLGLQKAADQH